MSLSVFNPLEQVGVLRSPYSVFLLLLLLIYDSTKRIELSVAKDVQEISKTPQRLEKTYWKRQYLQVHLQISPARTETKKRSTPSTLRTVMYSLHLPQLKNKKTNLISFEDPHKHENPPAWMPLPPHQISCLPAWPCIGISWLSPQGQIQVRICRFLKSHFTLGLGNQCQVEQQGWSVPFSSQLPCSPLLSPMTKDLNMRWGIKKTDYKWSNSSAVCHQHFRFWRHSLRGREKVWQKLKKNILKTLTGRIVKLGRRRELTSMLLPQVDLELAARGALTRW